MRDRATLSPALPRSPVQLRIDMLRPLLSLSEDWWHAAQAWNEYALDYAAAHPEPGMMLTQAVGSDRYVYQVTRVGPSGRVLWARHHDGSSQLRGAERQFRLTTRGWRSDDCPAVLGLAAPYWDRSF